MTQAGHQQQRHRSEHLVIGGGLASIDVAKIITLTCTHRALAERGIEIAIEELEARGIPRTLDRYDLRWEDLGLEGSSIYYRRRAEDMPLISIPAEASQERVEKVRKSRLAMLAKACEKFKLRLEPLSAPDGLIVEADRLVGIRFRRTRIEGERVIPLDETYERRAPAILSSIGSIPEAIEGIDMKGELFDFSDWTYGRLAAYPTVFSVGNVVTGKGNIMASRKHATRVCREAVEAFLGIADESAEDGERSNENIRPDLIHANQIAEDVAAQAATRCPMAPGSLRELLDRIAAQQRAVGYDGDFQAWLSASGDPC